MVVELNPNCEIFIMDNVTSLSSPTNPYVIKLDQLQYTSYQQSRLEVLSPEGRFLTKIGRNLTHMTDDDAIYQLWYQACLLEVLFDQIQDHVKLPHKAITSIVRIIDRIDGHLKRQIRQ